MFYRLVTTVGRLKIVLGRIKEKNIEKFQNYPKMLCDGS